MAGTKHPSVWCVYPLTYCGSLEKQHSLAKIMENPIYLFALLGILHGFLTPYTEEMDFFQKNTCLIGTSNKRNSKDDFRNYK